MKPRSGPDSVASSKPGGQPACKQACKPGGQRACLPALPQASQRASRRARQLACMNALWALQKESRNIAQSCPPTRRLQTRLRLPSNYPARWRSCNRSCMNACRKDHRQGRRTPGQQGNRPLTLVGEGRGRRARGTDNDRQEKNAECVRAPFLSCMNERKKSVMPV